MQTKDYGVDFLVKIFLIRFFKFKKSFTLSISYFQILKFFTPMYLLAASRFLGAFDVPFQTYN